MKDKLELSHFFSDVEKEEKYKHSDKTIADFRILLKSEDVKKILLFIIKNKIDFSHYGLQTGTYSKFASKLNPKNIEVFLSSSIVKKDLLFIENTILKNKDFFINSVNFQKVRKTRQKGSFHFANKVYQHFKNNINIKILEDFYLEKTEKNTIYVSNNDHILTEVLKKENISNIPEKGVDLILNINGNISFGEAKEINETGGAQNHQFKDLKNISNHPNGFGLIYGNILFFDNPIKREVEENPNIYTIWEFDEMIKSL